MYKTYRDATHSKISWVRIYPQKKCISATRRSTEKNAFLGGQGGVCSSYYKYIKQNFEKQDDIYSRKYYS